ncbi:hypothetical protein NMG60_11015764 [Bertholletia excelsa]
MQTPKTRNTSSPATPQKISPRAVRQQKTAALESDSTSSSDLANKTPKDRSPKVGERKSPRSPASEKKRPSRISELEFQISQLREDLKKAKDELSSSESSKRTAQEEAEESKKQLLAISSKLEESEKKLLDLSASEGARITELQHLSQEQEQAWQSKIKAIEMQHSIDSAALASAMNEIHQLKSQLEAAKCAESADAELHCLKHNLAETLTCVEDMKIQLRDCKESEARAQALVSETLLQLETAKKTVETLRLDGIKAMEAYNSVASELDKSRARVNSLEGLVSKLKDDCKLECEITEDEKSKKSMQLEEELASVTAEMGQLRAALESAEIRHHEEQIQSTLQIRSANELVEQIKSASCRRDAELEAELLKQKAEIEELKANLMDKETELQGISEENEGLHVKLEKFLSSRREDELLDELKKSKEDIECLRKNLMNRELELKNTMEENEILKLEMGRREMEEGKVKDEVVLEKEAAKAAEREALIKVGYMTEEADKSNKRAARVAEQLAAAQAANSEIEAELRRLKVQSDQWRKAAEAAAAMLSTGNNGKFVERTGSMDSSYNPMTGKMDSPYSEDMENDFVKKKNGNMFKKIGVLWKKPQK